MNILKHKPALGMKTTIGISVLLLTLAGCSSNAPQESGPDLQAGSAETFIDWIDAPRSVVNTPMVATECVQASGNRSMDGSRADIRARNSIASQMNTGVQSLTEAYDRAIRDQDGDLTQGGMDEEVIRGIVDQQITGSYRHRGGYVDRGNGREFCSLVKVSQDGIEDMLATIAAMNNAEEDVLTHSQMREAFMSGRMQDRLDSHLENQ